MCESKIYVKENGKEEMVAEDIVYIYFGENKITAVTLAGERIELEGYRVDKIDFMGHKVLLAKY
jgi:predicted RNA-binding protein